MLPFFPAALPGELFASRVSHYHILSGNSTVHDTFKELFHGGLFSLTHWVPKKLDRLAARIAGEQQAIIQGFYRDSTLLPLFRLFSGLPFRNEAGVIEGRGGDRLPRRIVGESGSTFVCTKCLAEDAEKYGTPFIHCTHQTPSVTSCWNHRIHLIDRCPNCRCPIEPPAGLILAPWQGCHCGQDFLKISELSQPSPTAVEISLARFAKVLLDHARNLDRSHNLAEVYRTRAMELGFRRGKKIDRAGLFSALEEHYGKNLLEKIDRAYRHGRTDAWLYTLSRPSFAESPITRHLILSNYLFREPEAFISQLSAISALPTPVGAGTRNTGHKKENAGDDSGASIKDLFDETLDRLVEKGRQHRLSVDDLWKTEYATMKRLVKLRPDAGQLIEQRLARPDSELLAKGISGNAAALVSDRDVEWAEAITAAANEVYTETAKPLRVSMNVLLNRAKIRPAKWLAPDVFPKTRAICEGLAESRWHFYARRLIWAINQLNGLKAGRAVITRAAGLENVRAGDVLTYFFEIGFEPTHEVAVDQLERVGIAKHWGGPYPDRTYENVGRNYVPRKSRRSQVQMTQRKADSDLGSNDD